MLARRRWYPATVHAVHADGTVWLMYDDGDEEEDCSTEFIRAPPPPPSPKQPLAPPSHYAAPPSDALGAPDSPEEA
jgi:hypothetical protein